MNNLFNYITFYNFVARIHNQINAKSSTCFIISIAIYN